MPLKSVIVIGNCLSFGVASAIREYVPGAQVFTAHCHVENLIGRIEELAGGADLILAQLGLDEPIYPRGLAETFSPYTEKTVRYPRTVFPAFHPDCVYATDRGKLVEGALVHYHSAIVIEAYRRKLSVNETVAAFNEFSYDTLGYFDLYEPSLAVFAAECKAAGLPADQFPAKWLGEAFMHTINHPRMQVAWDIAEYVLKSRGIKPGHVDKENFRDDPFIVGHQWPIYPEIAQRLHVPECGYQFKASTGYTFEAKHKVYDLRQFVEANFSAYANVDFDHVRTTRLEAPGSSDVKDNPFDLIFDAVRSRTARSARNANPYANLLDRQYWRRAISARAIADVDPVAQAPFRITPNSKIATAGSCFAQHIAEALKQSGYNYYVTEPAPDGMADSVARKRNYGVFSARYGNIYTARQLLQLIMRAYGQFPSQESAWPRPGDGKLVDPFRPQVEPAGFSTQRELDDSRAAHLAAVRQLIENADVFVFTLGLTEAWRSKRDGAIYPVAPGVAGGAYDPTKYEFINFRVAEVTDDLANAFRLIRQKNPNIKFILTVSPVPLVATYEHKHVLTATTYSKSVLRVAAEEISKEISDTFYFPSYEVITGNFNRGAYFADDLREVTPEGVQHVMRLFFKHFAGDKPALPMPAAERDSKPSAKEQAIQQVQSLYRIVCEEETLDPDYQAVVREPADRSS